MNKITDWVKRHLTVAFFILTFAITWGLGFSYGAVMKRGQFLLAPLFFIATCGPALAGILITAVSNTQPRQGARKATWLAFLVAWVVSTLVFLAHNTFINHAPLLPIMVGFAFVSVAPVAFVISMAYSRIPEVKSYLVSLIRLRGVLGWALLALVVAPGLALLSMVISSLIGRQPISDTRFPASGLALIGLIAVKFFYQLFFFNATGEEAGWRGFALPRMQARFSPLIASLVLVFFWAPWHFFLWEAQGLPVFTWKYWLDTYIGLIPAVFLLVWFYNRSHGSILVAGVYHAVANTTFYFLANLDTPLFIVVSYLAVIGIIGVDRMWKRLPPDHPAVYQSAYGLERIESLDYTPTPMA